MLMVVDGRLQRYEAAEALGFKPRVMLRVLPPGQVHQREARAYRNVSPARSLQYQNSSRGWVYFTDNRFASKGYFSVAAGTWQLTGPMLTGPAVKPDDQAARPSNSHRIT
jgi:hypothetical protein